MALNIDKEKVIETLKNLFSTSATVVEKDITETKTKETEEVKVEVKMEELKGKDDVVYQVNKFEVGEVVMDVDGNILAEGSYELEDGTKFSVDSEGKILSIEPVEESEQPEEESKSNFSVEEKLQEFDLRLNKIEELLSEAMKRSEDMEKSSTEMKKQVQKISNEPADEELKLEKKGYTNEHTIQLNKKLTKKEKMLNVIKEFRKIK